MDMSYFEMVYLCSRSTLYRKMIHPLLSALLLKRYNSAANLFSFLIVYQHFITLCSAHGSCRKKYHIAGNLSSNLWAFHSEACRYAISQAFNCIIIGLLIITNYCIEYILFEFPSSYDCQKLPDCIIFWLI